MFKNLSKFNIRKAMAWVDMPELGPKARILVKPATEANPNYYNAMLALSGKRVRAMVKTDKITAEDAALNRDDDVTLYPKHVIADWQGIQADAPAGSEGVDDKGNVIFNRRAAEQLCDALNKQAPHLLDRLRNTASTPERFYADDEIAPPDADELAGNSEGAFDSN